MDVDPALAFQHISRHRKCSLEDANALCVAVRNCFEGDLPSLGTIAWAVSESATREVAIWIAKRIANQHADLTLKDPNASSQVIVSQESPRQIGQVVITETSELVVPPDLEEVLKQKESAGPEGFALPGALNEPTGCRHAVRWPSICAICEPKRFAEMYGPR